MSNKWVWTPDPNEQEGPNLYDMILDCMPWPQEETIEINKKKYTLEALCTKPDEGKILLQCEISGSFYFLKKEEENGKIKVQMLECGMFIIENNREKNDKKYETSLHKDKCGCYKYASCLSYPCDPPGVCNKHPGCKNTIHAMSHRHICEGTPCNHIMCDRCFPETGNVWFPEDEILEQEYEETDSEDEYETSSEDNDFEEDNPERRRFETPCGQTYWINEKLELFTNEHVEISIGWWCRQDQCIYFNDPYSDSEDESDIEDYTPPPTPPPRYEEEERVEGEVIVWLGQSSN